MCFQLVMNHPEFHVFSYDDGSHISSIWKPADSECDIFKNLWRWGFRPTVSSKPYGEDITLINGLVYTRYCGLMTAEEFLNGNYTNMDIMCIQHYKLPLSKNDLLALVNYFKHIYSSGGSKPPHTRTYVRLSIMGCLDPYPEQDILDAPEVPKSSGAINYISADPKEASKWYDSFWKNHKWEYKKNYE